MTKRDLIEKFAETANDVNFRDAEIIVNTVLDTISQALARGEKIEIRGFGCFEIRERNPRKARNPKTGQGVAVQKKKVPFFKVGKELKQRVNK